MANEKSRKVVDVNAATSIMAKNRTLRMIERSEDGVVYVMNPPLRWRYVSSREGKNEGDGLKSEKRVGIRLKPGDIYEICDYMDIDKAGTDPGHKIRRDVAYRVNPEKFGRLVQRRLNIEYDPESTTLAKRLEGKVETNSDTGDTYRIADDVGEPSSIKRNEPETSDGVSLDKDFEDIFGTEQDSYVGEIDFSDLE